MGKFTRWFGAAAAGSLLVTGSVGCVSPKAYNDVRAERDAALLQRDVARAQAQGSKAEAEVYKAQLGLVASADEGKDLRITALSNETEELKNQLAEVNSRYTETMSDTPSAGASTLPASLKSELAAFAGKHAGVCEFDGNKGVIRFKSDACFGPGSAELNEKGKAAAKELATLLASKDGAGFELMVAGHTDSVPVSKSSTIKAGNKDNWFLSAHRAIAFGETLRDNHVHPRRLAMVGYADQRPVASNATESGRAANRRVEVLVMPVKLSAKELASAPTSGSKSASSSKASHHGGREATADARDLGFNK